MPRSAPALASRKVLSVSVAASVAASIAVFASIAAVACFAACGRTEPVDDGADGTSGSSGDAAVATDGASASDAAPGSDAIVVSPSPDAVAPFDGGPSPVTACLPADDGGIACPPPPSVCVDDRNLRYYYDGTCDSAGLCHFMTGEFPCTDSPIKPDCTNGGCRVVVLPLRGPRARERACTGASRLAPRQRADASTSKRPENASPVRRP